MPKSAMPLCWLRYRHTNQISVVIDLPAHARMRARLAGLDEGEFTEGYEAEATHSSRFWVEAGLLEFGKDAGCLP
jgi:hypothetical protein